MTEPAFKRDPTVWLDPHIEGDKNPVALLDTYLRSYTGGRFEILADTGHPNELTANDLAAVSMLSVNVPPRVAAWLLDPTGAAQVTALLGQIAPAPIWEQSADVLTDPDGALVRLDALLRAQTTQLPAREAKNEVGAVIASKLLAAKRPHLVPIYDVVVSGALGAPAGGWWLSWRNAMANPELRKRVKDVRDQVAESQPTAAALSDLRVCDAVIWMAEHGAITT